MKSPNWLFGQRKYEQSGSAPKVTSHEISNGGCRNETGVDGFCDLNWLSSEANNSEEDIFQRYAIWKCFYVVIGEEPPICLVYYLNYLWKHEGVVHLYVDGLYIVVNTVTSNVSWVLRINTKNI